MKTYIIDTECYPAYWLLSVLDCDTNEVQHFEAYPGQPLDVAAIRRTLKGNRVVTFNGNRYDLPMISLALKGADTDALKDASDSIIKNDLRAWEFERSYEVRVVPINHIDLIEVAPGIASLKTYGGRMHKTHLQDLPLTPDTEITPSLRPLMRRYCENDLWTTKALFTRLTPQIELRERMGEQYGMDLRSKSDAQIAEVVISHEVQAINGEPVAKPRVSRRTFNFKVPKFLVFQTPELNALVDEIAATKFSTGESGVVKMPTELAGRKIKLGAGTYRMGIGGLHSSEKSTQHIADKDTVLIDRDVASYYPSIILTNGLYPEQMGPAFTTVYRGIVQRRLEAKRSGDKVTNEVLKITINGSFGKLGSPYSLLYAPHLMIQTTVTGQLALLMLIEMLEQARIPVVSANTDGIVIKCPRSRIADMDACVTGWELVSGFETEATEYAALYSRDVNGYVAVKPNGMIKVKGPYASSGLAKNTTADITTAAAIAYLTNGVPVDKTIRGCTDIRQFVSIRNVKGGAVDQEGNHLGRVARWYYSTEVDGAIRYALNGKMVAATEGARPLMTLPDFLPKDIDYNTYVQMALRTLADLGVRITHDMPSGTMLDEVEYA
jgi:DNA polymerase elongation subunit (family B)